jgi:hypothetical protein
VGGWGSGKTGLWLSGCELARSRWTHKLRASRSWWLLACWPSHSLLGLVASGGRICYGFVTFVGGVFKSCAEPGPLEHREHLARPALVKETEVLRRIQKQLAKHDDQPKGTTACFSLCPNAAFRPWVRYDRFTSAIASWLTSVASAIWRSSSTKTSARPRRLSALLRGLKGCGASTTLTWASTPRSARG